MKTTRQLFAATALVALMTAAPVLAQDATPEAEQEIEGGTEDEIVVSGTFLDKGSKSAMKMDVPVLDTPFSVSSYSNEFVKSLETQNVADLYNYMTGLKKSGVTAYDITLRGYKSGGDDRNAIMVDGLPGMTGRYGSPPTIGIERVELVKGPMAVLYGQIQPGGFVNLITKKPQANSKLIFDVRTQTFAAPVRNFGDHNSIAGAFDATGAVIDGVNYRLLGQVTRNQGFRNDAYSNQEFLAPSLDFELSPQTNLTLQFEYRATKERFDTGLAAPFDGATLATSTKYDITRLASLETVYQNPDNFRFEKGTSASAYFTHAFGDWRVNVGYRHVRSNSEQKDITPMNVTKIGGVDFVTRRARHLFTQRKYDYADANVSGSFNTGSIEHKLLVGINGGIDTVIEDRPKFFSGAQLNVRLYNPDFSTTPAFDSLPNGPIANLSYRDILSRNYGIYVSDLITLTDWLKVSVAARKFSEFSRTYPDRRNTPAVVGRRTTKKDFLPSAGILIQPTNNITIYGSYAESFVPVDPGLLNLQGTNSGFVPITGSQKEAGIKTERLLDGKLGFTAAVYQIDNIGQTSQTICNFGNGSCSVQLGKSRSRGFELEGNASPLPNWQIIFGYTYIDAKVLSAGPGFEFQVGRRLPNVAKNAANLWTRYDFSNGFGIGLGVTHTGQREGILPTQSNDLLRLDLPAYTVVDAALYYTRERYSFNLKIGNILNETYYQNSGGGSLGRVQIQPGDPRYLTLTGRFNF